MIWWKVEMQIYHTQDDKWYELLNAFWVRVLLKQGKKTHAVQFVDDFEGNNAKSTKDNVI